MYKQDLEKAEEPEIKLLILAGSQKKQESSRKPSTSALLTMSKPLTVWITKNCGKFLKRWNTRSPDLPPEKSICRSEATVRTGYGTQTCSKLGKEYLKAVLSPCSFNLCAEYLMKNVGLDEAQAGIKIAERNINNVRYEDDTTLMAESEEQRKNLLMKVKEEGEIVGLKLNIQKTKIMASGPITSWETMETVSDFIFGGSKITTGGYCSHEIKRRLLLGKKVMTNLDSIFKSRDITLPTKVCLVKDMVFPVVMYGCES